MLTVIIFLLILTVLGILYVRWARSNKAARDQLRWDARESAFILVALLALTLLPASLLLPLPEWAPRGLLLAVALVAWGVLAMAFWTSHVVPVEALALPSAPPRYPRLQPGAPPAPLLDSQETETVQVGDVERHFRWTFTARDGRPIDMSIQLKLNSERYEAARAEERRPVGDWAHYAELDMPELHALAAEFSRLHRDRDWSTLEQASNVLCFTQQCIDYQLDEDATPQAEWPRYPIETLMDQQGDCEDDVILTAAVLKRLGFDVALLYYPGHCALGVAGARGLPGEYVVQDGKEYFYGETTEERWHLGEVPQGYMGHRLEKVEVVQRMVVA